MVIAGLVGSLGSLARLTETSYLTAADQFSWMVLVQGDSLQNDEIGGRLRQLPGAREVTYVSSDSAFQDLQKDPLYMVDTSAFEAKDLPNSWRVHWDARAVDFSLLPIFAGDVRHLDGVMEVAYDPRHLDFIHRLRVHFFAIQTALWCVGFLAATATLLLIGRLLFFKSPRNLSWGSVGRAAFRDELWWLLGCVPVWFALSRSLPWPFAVGGWAVGVLHALWDAHESR